DQAGTPNATAPASGRALRCRASRVSLVVLAASKDKGATWTELPVPEEVKFGPYFGKDENHFVLVGKSGFQETTDAGETWKTAAPLPAGFGVGRVGPNYAWDPNIDCFYASTMTKPTFKYERRAGAAK